MRRLLIAVLAFVALLFAAVGWYFSNEILGPDRRPGNTGQTVLAHTDSTITLVATRKARRAGEWAIEWPGGYGRIGPLIEEDDARVVTHFRIVSGRPPDTTSRAPRRLASRTASSRSSHSVMPRRYPPPG